MQVLLNAVAVLLVSLAVVLAFNLKAMKRLLDSIAYYNFFGARFQPHAPGLPAPPFCFHIGPVRPKRGVFMGLLGLQNTQQCRVTALVEPPGARIDGDPILEVLDPTLAIVGGVVVDVAPEMDQQRIAFDVVSLDGAPNGLTDVKLTADRRLGEQQEMIEASFQLAIVGPEATGFGFTFGEVSQKETAPPA